MQHVVDVCAAQGLPESVVAAQLRPRGIDLAQLQAQAAEVQRGIAECASDEGWKLIQVGQHACTRICVAVSWTVSSKQHAGSVRACIEARVSEWQGERVSCGQLVFV